MVKTSTRLKRLFTAVALYTGIVIVTLVLLDLALIVLGILPPKRNLGDPTLGWIAAVPTGRMNSAQCVEHSTGDTITYIRNEEGLRTPVSIEELGTSGPELRIAVTGDSQTDLCATNAQTHAGALETALTERGVPALVLPYGAGGYSPLQDYLVFEQKLKKYEPDVLVLNLYTGNDFYDILRSDDRPHFVPVDTGYMVAAPLWFRFDEPGTPRRSRILYLARIVGDRVGVRGIVQRIKALSAVAAEHGERMPTVLAYLNDLRRSRDSELGYPAALSAQLLNQQLFLTRFPGIRAESLRRLRALLDLARRENPGLILVLSAIPSYQLVQEQPVDSVLLRTVARLPITYEEGVQQERALYDTLATLAAESGWLFVDNLAALKTHDGPERLFNDFDYHLLPVASEIIGTAQANALEDYMQSRPSRQEGAAVAASRRREAR